MTAISPSPVPSADLPCPAQVRKTHADHNGDKAVLPARPGVATHPTLQLVHPAPLPALHERRTADRRASRSTFGLSLGLSVLAHVVAGALAWWLSAAPTPTTLTAETRDIFEISVIPLSALDTVLPLGSTAPTTAQLPPPPEVTNPSPPTQQEKIQPPKKAAPATQRKAPQRKALLNESAATAPQASDVSAQNASAQSSTSQATAASTDPSAPGRLGVPTGDSSVTEPARINYQEAVASLLARAKRYPERALRRGLTGEGAIRIEIRADGELSRFEIVRSTDLPLLDEELRAMVDRASPFPAFPADLRRPSITLIVPVTFTITAGRG